MSSIHEFPCLDQLEVRILHRRSTMLHVLSNTNPHPPLTVDEAHCCDTSRSLQVLIGWHSKATSSSKGANPYLWSNSCTDQTCEYSYQLNLLLLLVPCDTRGMPTKYRILTLENRLCEADAYRKEGRETRHRFTTSPNSSMDDRAVSTLIQALVLGHVLYRRHHPLRHCCRPGLWPHHSPLHYG